MRLFPVVLLATMLPALADDPAGAARLVQEGVEVYNYQLKAAGRRDAAIVARSRRADPPARIAEDFGRGIGG